MIIISDYTLIYDPEQDVYRVKANRRKAICPVCGKILSYRDSRTRIRRREGGIKQSLIIHRLHCRHCHSYHNELPDCLVPYKQYDAETIGGVLSGIVTQGDLDSEDYPCADTMSRWFFWAHILGTCLIRENRLPFPMDAEPQFSEERFLLVLRTVYEEPAPALL